MRMSSTIQWRTSRNAGILLSWINLSILSIETGVLICGRAVDRISLSIVYG